MTASIWRPEFSASAHSRRPSTKIDSVTLPSRTARTRRSRELSRLAIFILRNCRRGAEKQKRIGHRLTQIDTDRTSFFLSVKICVYLWLSFVFNLRPDRPMIGNVQRLGHAPSFEFHVTTKNPVRVKRDDSRAAPSGDVCRKRSRVAARFHQLANFDRFLLRQGVEVAENYDRAVMLFCD